MEFIRKKIRGQNHKVRRTWLSAQQYRIIWRREVHGVRVPARFQATVRTILPNGEMWDFVGRRLFKTFAAAQEACEKHEQLWTKAAEVSGIRSLQELFGKVPLGFPKWVKSKLNRRAYGLLTDTSAGRKAECDAVADECNDRDIPTQTSICSVSSTDGESIASTPVLPVADEAGSLKTSCICPSAPSAEAPAREQKKRAARRTSTRSSSTKTATRKPTRRTTTKKSTSSTSTSNSGDKQSRNSRGKKSKRSGS